MADICLIFKKMVTSVGGLVTSFFRIICRHIRLLMKNYGAFSGLWSTDNIREVKTFMHGKKLLYKRLKRNDRKEGICGIISIRGC